MAELTAQVQELSELYEAEIQRRSDAETQRLEVEAAMEKLKEEHACELQACRDHANAHVAQYRKKSADLKDKVRLLVRHRLPEVLNSIPLTVIGYIRICTTSARSPGSQREGNVGSDTSEVAR